MFRERARACSRAPRRRRRWRGPVAMQDLPLPDRPPEVTARDARLPGVELRKRLERAIRGGHPWVYRDALAGAPRLRRRRGRAADDAQRQRAGRRLLGRALAHRGAHPRRRRARRTRARRRRRSPRGGAGAPAGVHRSARRPTPFAGSTARPTGCRAFTSTSTAGRRAFAATATGARAFYRDLPERLRATAAKAGLALRTVVERRRARGGADAPRRHGPRSRGAPRPPASSRCARTACASASICCAGRRAGCSWTSATTARWCGRWRPDRRVLNLFGYTGGFSIYAAAGGARATVTVDAAAPAIAAARRNFERNRLPTGDARFVSRGRVRVPRARGARRRALRPGDLRPAQLRAQPARAARGPARLPAAAPAVRGRHGAGRHAVRGVVLEPRRPRGVPGDRARRARATPGGASSCTSCAAPAADHPVVPAISRGRLPEIRRGCPMMRALYGRRTSPAPAARGVGHRARPRTNGRSASRWRLLQSAVYFGIGHLHLNRSTELLRTRLDDAIPFWPWTAVVLPAVLRGRVHHRDRGLRRRALFNRACLAVLIVMSLGALGHIFIGARVPAPRAAPALRRHLGGFPGVGPAHRSAGQRVPVAARRAHDDAGADADQGPPAAGAVALAMATALALSTLTTKQHFIADVLSGYVLAFFGRWFALRKLPSA